MMTQTTPILWAIGGHDNTGRAGLSADAQVAQALSVHLCPIVTIVTAQTDNTARVLSEVSVEHLIEQCASALALGTPSAIKVGAITGPQMRALAHWLHAKGLDHTPLIWDPITHSSTGQQIGHLPDDNERKLWFSLVDWITPNLSELTALTGQPADHLPEREQAMAALRAAGIPQVVVTGGHARQTNQVVDSWQDSTGIRHFATPRHPHANLRGTGCRLATLIACHLVQGSSAGDAVVRSLMCLNHAIGKPVCLLAGHGYPAPQALTPTQASLPTLLFDSHWPQVDTERCFRPIPHPIGLYPIVDSLDWLERLQHYELAMIQLRLKKPLAQCRNEIRTACELARKAGIRLIVNDHWQAAIEYGAFGVHLGQDDLAKADLDAIAHANLALGVSTHDYFELVRALALSPSYVALGHIFPTPTKVMPSAPQGLQRLAEYVKLPLPVPTVAIGGIDLDNVRSVADTGVDGVAVVRAITQAPDLDATIRRFQSLFKRRK